jgi:hypothetical protein
LSDFATSPKVGHSRKLPVLVKWERVQKTKEPKHTPPIELILEPLPKKGNCWTTTRNSERKQKSKPVSLEIMISPWLNKTWFVIQRSRWYQTTNLGILSPPWCRGFCSWKGGKMNDRNAEYKDMFQAIYLALNLNSEKGELRASQSKTLGSTSLT